MAAQKRPLSPFMIGSVYRPQITSMMSIAHRGTGVVLALGAFVLTAWLLAAAGSAESYAGFQACAGSLIGKLALFVFSACLVYHLLNGLRHLLWDIGWGFEIPQLYRSGYAVLALAVVVTALIWYIGLNTGGAV